MGKIKTTANKVRRKLKQIQGQIEEEAASANQSADFRIKKTQVYFKICKTLYLFYIFSIPHCRVHLSKLWTNIIKNKIHIGISANLFEIGFEKNFWFLFFSSGTDVNKESNVSWGSLAKLYQFGFIFIGFIPICLSIYIIYKIQTSCEQFIHDIWAIYICKQYSVNITN